MVQVGEIPVSRARMNAVAAPTQSVEAAGGLGRVITNTAGVLADEALREVQKDAVSHAVKATTDFEVAQYDRMEKLKTTVKDINQYAPEYEKLVDKDMADTLAAAPNDYAREAMQDRLVQMRGGLVQNAKEYMSKERKQLQAQNASNAMNEYANLVFNKPELLDHALMRAEGNIAAARQYLDPADVAKLQENTSSMLLEAKVRGELAKGNIDAAAKDLTSPEFAKHLKNDAMMSLGNQVAAAQEKQVVSNLAIMPLAEQYATLESLRGKENYTEIANKIEAVNKDRQNDPIQFARSYGLMPDLTPLDPSNPQEFAKQVESRVALGKKMQAAYGTQVKAFDDFEAKNIADTLGKLPPENQVQTLLAMNAGAGADAVQVVRQLGEKDKSLGVASSMLANNRENASVVQDMLEGRSMARQNPDVLKVYGGTAADAEFASSVGNAFEYSPSAEAAVKDAVQYLAAKRGYGKGIKFDDQKEIYNQAIQDVLGADGKTSIIDYKNRKLVLPQGVKEDEFRDFAALLTMSDYKNLSVGKSEPMAATAQGQKMLPPSALHDAEFISVAPGMYYLKTGNGIAQAIGSADPYILQVSPEIVRSVLRRAPPKELQRSDLGYK